MQIHFFKFLVTLGRVVYVEWPRRGGQKDYFLFRFHHATITVSFLIGFQNHSRDGEEQNVLGACIWAVTVLIEDFPSSEFRVS